MTSKRVATTMKEIAGRQKRYAAMVISNKWNRTGRSRKNHALKNAVQTDGGFLIQSLYRTTLTNLEDARPIMADGGLHIERKVATLSLELGDDYLRSLITCTRELLTDIRGVPASVARHIILKLSAY